MKLLVFWAVALTISGTISYNLFKFIGGVVIHGITILTAAVQGS